jgi:hypothetical protein
LPILKNAGIEMNKDDLHYLGKSGRANFSLLIGSRQAYAGRYNQTDGELYFIGHGMLHGLFPLEKKDICALTESEHHLIEGVPGYPRARHPEWSL